LTNSIKYFYKILSKLTFFKILNIAKLYFSYIFSIISKRYIFFGKPSFVSIEPTNICNLFCPECPTGQKTIKRETGNIDFELYLKIINELSPFLTYLTLYHQGEPLLHPQLFELIKYAHTKNIFTTTSTNAQFIDDKNSKAIVESGLDKLIISIDGIDQDTYSTYRIGGDLNKVINGTKSIIKWKKELKSSTPFLVFQFLVLKNNEHQINDIISLGKNIGVNSIEIKTAQINDYKLGNKFIPENAKFSRYKKNTDNTYSLKNKLPNKCWRMWSSAVITFNGIVIPCCFDKNIIHKMGNITGNSFVNVWGNAKYIEFRKRILNSRKEIQICTNCSKNIF
jgi:radical SAM protein with 4Fe4S-binding SPASM domain